MRLQEEIRTGSIKLRYFGRGQTRGKGQERQKFELSDRVRHRYYVSAPCIRGQTDEPVGSVTRVPASELEVTISKAVMASMGIDEPLSNDTLSRKTLERFNREHAKFELSVARLGLMHCCLWHCSCFWESEPRCRSSSHHIGNQSYLFLE